MPTGPAGYAAKAAMELGRHAISIGVTAPGRCTDLVQLLASVVCHHLTQLGPGLQGHTDGRHAQWQLALVCQGRMCQGPSCSRCTHTCNQIPGKSACMLASRTGRGIPGWQRPPAALKLCKHGACTCIPAQDPSPWQRGAGLPGWRSRARACRR